MDKKQYKSIDEYISGFPENIQNILQNLRRVIHQAAPDAQETISYGMPAFRLDGILVYFAAFKDHIGFFPTASGVRVFAKELAPYDVSKGTIRFPIDKPIPDKLVAKIVKFRVQENLNRKKK